MTCRVSCNRVRVRVRALCPRVRYTPPPKFRLNYDTGSREVTVAVVRRLFVTPPLARASGSAGSHCAGILRVPLKDTILVQSRRMSEMLRILNFLVSRPFNFVSQVSTEIFQLRFRFMRHDATFPISFCYLITPSYLEEMPDGSLDDSRGDSKSPSS